MMLRHAFVALAVTLLVAGGAWGQAQRSPATLDDLLTEIRALRSDLNDSSNAALRAQLVMARLALQEGRINAVARQLTDVRQQLSSGQLALAQLKPFLDPDGKIPEPFRATFEQMQKSDLALRSQESELAGLIAIEQNRWLEFNARLDELERALR